MHIRIYVYIYMGACEGLGEVAHVKYNFRTCINIYIYIYTGFRVSCKCYCIYLWVESGGVAAGSSSTPDSKEIWKRLSSWEEVGASQRRDTQREREEGRRGRGGVSKKKRKNGELFGSIHSHLFQVVSFSQMQRSVHTASCQYASCTHKRAHTNSLTQSRTHSDKHVFDRGGAAKHCSLDRGEWVQKKTTSSLQHTVTHYITLQQCGNYRWCVETNIHKNTHATERKNVDASPKAICIQKRTPYV